MKKLLTSSLLAAGGWLSYASERPNIVLFMVDDMGWQVHSDPLRNFMENYYPGPMRQLLKQHLRHPNH